MKSNSKINLKSIFKDLFKEDISISKVQIFTIIMPIIVVLGVIIAIFANIDHKNQSYNIDKVIKNTHFRQTVYGDNAEKISQKANKRIDELQKLLLCDVKGSDIDRINSRVGMLVYVNPLTISIIDTCIDIANKSNGAFNPLSYSLTSLWNFDELDNKSAFQDKLHIFRFQNADNIVPSEERIKSSLSHMNYNDIYIDRNKNGIKILDNFSGLDIDSIFKGIICDEIIKTYREQDAKSGIISTGENVGIFGTKSNGEPWNIAIKDQLKEDDKNGIAILKLKDGFVSTHSPYENYFKKDGTVYHHILNPKTGYPAGSDLISITVYHNNMGLVADILSNACFVLERDKALELLKYYNAEAIFIYKNKDIYATEGIKENLMITNENYTLR